MRRLRGKWVVMRIYSHPSNATLKVKDCPNLTGTDHSAQNEDAVRSSQALDCNLGNALNSLPVVEGEDPFAHLAPRGE